MKARSMVVVAGGSSDRFGSDKLMVEVAGQPLIAHTIATISGLVDECVLVVRSDQVDRVRTLGLGVEVVPGGDSRTASEIAGIAAVGPSALIGVHDGARPLPDPMMIERLFARANEFGGAVPGLAPRSMLVNRDDLSPVVGAVRVQTPQVFWGPELKAAYLGAARDRYEGHDTADVVRQYTNLEIALVEGDPNNIKVTFPADLSAVLERLGGG